MPENKKILVTQKIIIADYDGKILTIRRSKTCPTKPLSWDFPGGLVEVGEDIEAAIIREVKEETGLNILKPTHFTTFNYTTEQGTYLLCIGYKAQTEQREVVLSYEHDMFEWVLPSEIIERDMKAHVKELMKLYEAKRT